MVDTTSTPLQGQATATVQQALGWAMRNNPEIGACDGSPAAGAIMVFLQETERLSDKVGLDFAVVVAHASAQTDGFSSSAWKEALDALPGATPSEARGVPSGFNDPLDAARAHVMYLGNLLGGASTRAAGTEVQALQELRDAGYEELLGERAQTAQTRSATPVADLDDLPGVDTGKIRRHLDAIRSDRQPREDPGPPPGAPPLPNIQLVPTDHYHFRPGGMRPVAICYHITNDLSLDNVLNWFRQPGSGASSTFVLARDGTPYQMISSLHAPWTNGDYRDPDTGAWNNPRTDIAWLNAAIDACERHENNLNDFFVTYEFIGTPDTPPTPAQYETAIQLSRYFCHDAVYGIGRHRGRHLRHADINSVSRSYDPGHLFQLAHIIESIGGDPQKLDD